MKITKNYTKYNIEDILALYEFVAKLVKPNVRAHTPELELRYTNTLPRPFRYYDPPSWQRLPRYASSAGDVFRLVPARYWPVDTLERLSLEHKGLIPDVVRDSIAIVAMGSELLADMQWARDICTNRESWTKLNPPSIRWMAKAPDVKNKADRSAVNKKHEEAARKRQRELRDALKDAEKTLNEALVAAQRADMSLQKAGQPSAVLIQAKAEILLLAKQLTEYP